MTISTATPTTSPDPDPGATDGVPISVINADRFEVDFNRLEVDFEDSATRIGVGTYGSVHVARYFGELVAVKRIIFPGVTPHLADDPYLKADRARALRDFAAEIRKYEQVSHPGIVRFLGVTLPPDNSALLVTELMHGGSLGDALDSLRKNKVPLRFDSFARMCLQACGGLRALHAAGCTWGDAKPENILLSATVDALGHFPAFAQARISDFGLSKSVADNLLTLTETTVSSSGQPPGTYNYMAPETFARPDQDDPDVAKMSDIYSFAMVMYEMLTLRTPWKRRQLFEVCDKLLQGTRPQWPTEGDKDYYGPIPADLKSLVEKCWTQDPTQRLTAEQVFDALDKFSLSLFRGEDGGERHVTDLSNNGDFSGVPRLAALDGEDMQRVASKQSSASTAVAVPDVSVDLQSSVLNSSKESGPFTGDQAIFDSLNVETMELGNTAPRVSPLTSPEPRLPIPQDHADTNLDAERARHDGPTEPSYNHVARERAAAAIDSHIEVFREVEEHIVDPTEPHVLGHADKQQNDPERREETPLDENTVVEQFNTMDLREVQAFEMEAHREEILAQTSHAPVAVTEVSNVESSDAFGEEPQEDRLEAVPLDNMATASPGMGNTLEGSIVDLTSSAASSSSLRGKRSRRLQSIIEHCVIELRKREEAKSKIPPKQRKDAAAKKAMEEAKQLSEQEALKAIDGAQATGDISLILDKMKEHRNSSVVVKTAAMHLRHYCRNESMYFDICEEGGIEELLAGVVRFGHTDIELCVAFCESVTALSEHYNDKVGHLVRAAGVPSAVVEVLDVHKNSIPLQVAGCNCLAAIAAASELSRSAVATLGGPAAVYRAVTKNNITFKDVDLARASLRAVRQIAQDNERAAEFLVQVSALDAVSRTAAVFTDHGLEGDILDALRAFSFYTGGRRNIIMSSGLKALAEIMLRNDNPDFLVACCQFIRAIAQWRNVECEEAMLRSCIAERVTTLMQNSNDRPGEPGAKVGWYACQACLFLASFGSQSRKRLRQVGAIETAISILNHRRENARVARCATDALAELLKGEPESKIYAERSGVVPALNAALELHRNDIKVRSAVQWTLDCLSSTHGTISGPAHGSQMHQELVNNESNPENVKPKRGFLGFKFMRKRNQADVNRDV